MRRNTSFMQEFRFDKKYITLMKVCFLGFVAFFILGFVSLLFPGDKGVDPGLTLLYMLVFGTLSTLTWLTLKKLPFANVGADDDGIWYLHIGKRKGLIQWGKISKVKERTYMQCLDLLDFNGEKLLRVEYQLLGFESLRIMLYEKTNNASSESGKSTFSKSPLYHLFHLVGVLGFSAIGYYVGSDGNPLLGYGAMSLLVSFIVHEYLFTATGIEIESSNFKINFPLSKTNVPFSDVEKVLVKDDFHKGNRFPEVWLISKSVKKPFKFKNIGADSNVLYKALKSRIE